jgi:hypothetical protein
MNASINAASIATASSERNIESALNLLRINRPCNVHGVYMDRRAMMSDLMAARRDIDAAWNALNGDWPATADYLGV